MADIEKQYDWLASLVLNPDLGLNDFKKLGVTPDTATLKNRSDYETLPQIQEHFKNESGEFDKNAFNKFYDNALLLYNNYAMSEYVPKATEMFGYLDTEWDRPQGSKVIDATPRFSVSPIAENQSFGIYYINKYGNGLFAKQSAREIAQQQNVVDFETGETLDWTPDDKSGIIDALFRPTVVLASYDNDEYDENGTLLHKKGDLKYNEKGRPYYETLGNRSILGKQVLAYSDSLTKEGSWLNKYDFFDSDGLDKSMIGTIAKTVFTTAPYLIPGVGEVLGGITAFVALNRVLPVLGKAIAGVANGKGEDAFTQSMNKWESVFARFDPSVSDRSQEHLVTLENLGNLVSSISGQLFQQRVIGAIPTLLNKSGDMAKNAKWGRALAYGYMSLTSAQDSFNTFKNAGASDMVAGWAFIANAIALGGLMASDYGKGLLFKGTWLDENFLRQPAIQAANEVREKLTSGIEKASTKEKAKFIQGLINIYNKHFSSAATDTFINRGFSEALEEVMEEGIIDIQKAITSVAESIGVNVGDQKLDFGFSGTDVLQRYGMAAAGGFLGGGIFHLQGRWDNFLANDMTQHTDEDTLKKLTYYIGQGRGQEIRNMYTKWHAKGLLGSTSLGTDLTSVVSINGKETVSEPVGTKLSQNDVVYNAMMKYIDSIEDTISKEGLLKDVGTLTRAALNGYKESERSLRADTLINLGVHDLLINDLYDVGAKIISANAALQSEINRLTVKEDTADAKRQSEENIKNSEKIKSIEEDLKKLREKRDAILNGDNNWDYVGKAIFVSNPLLAKNFIDLDIEHYSRLKLGRNHDSLSEEEKAALKVQYDDYMKDDGKNKLLRAYDLYLLLEQRYANRLMQENELLKDSSVNDQRSVETRFKEELSKKLKEWQDISREYGILMSKENKSNEDLLKLGELKQQLDSLELSINQSSENAYSMLIHKSGDNTEIINLLSKGILTSEESAQAFSLIKQMYQNYASNKTQLNNDFEYESLLRNVVADFIRTASIDKRVDSWLSSLEYRESNNGDDFGLWQSWLIENNLSDLLYNEEEDETNYNSEFLRNIKQLANQFIENLGVDNQTALTVLDQIKSLMQERGFSSEDTNLLLSQIVPQYFDNSELLPITDFIKEIDELRKNIKYSSFSNLLKDFISDVLGDENSLLDLLKSEKLKLANSPNLQDYFIRNPETINELEETITLLKALRGVIRGASPQDKTNSSINSAKGGENRIVLPELDENTAQILYRQSFDLENEIQTLLDIAKLNGLRTLRVHEEIDKYMRGKFIYTLINNPVFVQKFGEKFYTTDEHGNKTPINIEQICNDILQNRIDLSKSETADPGELLRFEVEFETALYEAVLNSTIGNDSKAIGKALVELFTDAWNLDTTILNTDTEEITSYSLLSYIQLILSYPAKSFYTKYEQVTQAEDSKFAPIYSQEMALRSVVAEFVNPELSNAIVEELSKKVDISKIDPKDTQTIKWLQNLSVLKNFVIIPGGAGCGKTTAIATNVAKMFNDYSHEYFCLAPETEQSENLANAVGENIRHTDKATFFKNVFGLDLQNYRFNEKIGHTELAEVPVINNNLFDKSKNLKVLFIDEVSLFTESELKLLSDYAVNNGIIVVGLGDPIQNSGKVYTDEILTESGETRRDKEKTNHSTGLEDCIYFGSSYLTASLRPSNLAKLNNFNSLNRELNNVMKEWKKQRWLTFNELDKFVSGNINLHYFENSDLFYGEKLVEDDENLVELAKKYSERGKVTIITDDLNKYQNLPSGIDKRLYNKMQGMETDFVLVDVDFVKNNNFGGKVSKYSTIRDLYTLTQRSRIGTIIKKDGLTEALPELTFELKKEDGQRLLMDEQDINMFKEKRGTILATLDKFNNLFDFIKNIKVPYIVPNVTIQSESSIIQNDEIETKAPINTTTLQQQNVDVPTPQETNTPASNSTEKPSAPVNNSVVPQKQADVKPVSYQQAAQSLTIKPGRRILEREFIGTLFNSDFVNVDRTLPNSISNWSIRNNGQGVEISDDNYRKLIWTLGSGIKTGLHVNLDGIIKKIIDDPKNSKINTTIFASNLKRTLLSTPEIYIEPYNDRYRIITAIYRNGSDFIKIPISFTETTAVGKYLGKFKRNENLHKINNDSRWRPLAEFLMEHPELEITPEWGVVTKEYNPKERNVGKVSIVFTDQMAYMPYLYNWYKKDGETFISHYKDLCHMCIQKPAIPQEILQFVTTLKYKDIQDPNTLNTLMQRGLWETNVINYLSGNDLGNLYDKGAEFYKIISGRAWQILPKNRALTFMKTAIQSLYDTNDFNNMLINMTSFMHFLSRAHGNLEEEIHGMLLSNGNTQYFVKSVIENGKIVGYKAIPYSNDTYVETNNDPFFNAETKFPFVKICQTLFGQSVPKIEFVREIKTKNRGTSIQELTANDNIFVLFGTQQYNLELLNDRLLQNQEFINGVYVQDTAGELLDPSGAFNRFLGNKNGYWIKGDVVNTTWSIDETAIESLQQVSPESNNDLEFKQQFDKIKQIVPNDYKHQWDEKLSFGLQMLSSGESVENTINYLLERINRNMAFSRNDWHGKRIIKDGDKYRLESYNNFDLWLNRRINSLAKLEGLNITNDSQINTVVNKLDNGYAIIEIVNSDGSKLHGVLLKSNNQYYYRPMNDEYRSTDGSTTFEKYMQLQEAIDTLGPVLNPIQNYLNSLVFSYKESNKIDPVYVAQWLNNNKEQLGNFNELLNNYLEQRILANEC